MGQGLKGVVGSRAWGWPTWRGLSQIVNDMCGLWPTLKQGVYGVGLMGKRLGLSLCKGIILCKDCYFAYPIFGVLIPRIFGVLVHRNPKKSNSKHPNCKARVVVNESDSEGHRRVQVAARHTTSRALQGVALGSWVGTCDAQGFAQQFNLCLSVNPSRSSRAPWRP